MNSYMDPSLRFGILERSNSVSPCLRGGSVQPGFDVDSSGKSPGQPASAGTTFQRSKIVLHLPVKPLQDEESLFLLPVLIDQPFSVEIVLDARQCAPGTAKILENPRRHSPKE